MNKIKTLEMEIALSQYFNVRKNLIVPNLFWSFFRHELDLFILTPANYGYEVEIKVSLSDLKKDIEKKHGHRDRRIKYLYFALPDYITDYESIPEHAGILSVSKKHYINRRRKKCVYYRTKLIRKPVEKSKHKFTDDDRNDLMRLAALRVWTMKQKLLRSQA